MKKFEGLLPMNLQFFAEEGEGASENTAAVAEQPQEAETEGTNEGTETGVTEEAATPPVQSEEANRAFASMRREKEAAERRLADLDRAYANQFGNLKNPETGEPIRSAQDYFDALAAQERMNAREQLRQNNVDPALIDKMIAASPVVRQAQQATAELNNIRAKQMMDADFEEVLKIDPELTSRDAIVNDPSYADVVNYCAQRPGMRFSEAYKLVNFDRLSSSKTAAARQAAVNQVKGQNHLSTAPGVNVQSSEEDIPANMIETWKEQFPDKSMKELKALYNQVMKTRR